MREWPIVSILLDELERHSVTLADRRESLAIDITERVAGRERPDSIGVILRVSWIRVDLTAGNLLETGPFDKRDEIVFADVRRRRLGILLDRGITSVLDDTQYAAGLEDTRKAFQCSFLRSPLLSSCESCGTSAPYPRCRVVQLRASRAGRRRLR